MQREEQVISKEGDENSEVVFRNEKVESSSENEEAAADEAKEEQQREEIEPKDVTPIQGEVKWDMSNTLISWRNEKKPDWLGENVMVAKLEQTSRVDVCQVCLK